MIRNMMKAAMIATVFLGGLAATPAAAQRGYDRGGYENNYRQQSRRGGDRYDRYDRYDRNDRRRHWRSRYDDDRGRRHHHRRGGYR
jgi:hypothetical protein